MSLSILAIGLLCANYAAAATTSLRGPADSDVQSLKATVTSSKSFQDKVAESCNGEKAADKKAQCVTSTTDKLFCMLLQRSNKTDALKEAQCQPAQPQESFAAVKAKIIQSD